MKPLIKLRLLKIKGNIRNLFRKKSTGVFTIIITLFYGALFVGLLGYRMGAKVTLNFDMHLTILIFVGALAMMLLSTMMQSRKALFYGDDAFYLFTGPFTRSQVMSYLTLQTITQALLLSLISVFLMSTFSSAPLTMPFVILMYICGVISVITSLIFDDYIYVLSIGDTKYKKISKLIVLGILLFVVVILGITYLQTNNLNTLIMDFVQSNLFYVVPVFGWVKLVLVAYVESNYLMMLIGLVLLIGLQVIVYLCFINYKGDFYEQAFEDSIEFSKKMKEAKAGNQDALRKFKINKDAKEDFRQGAGAILSKNILMMKRTKSFVSPSEIISILIYGGVTIFSGLGMGMFVYMMTLWVFTMIQGSQLTKELQNYQIYLIPDKPFKKLIVVIIPTFIKIIILSSIAFIIVGIYYKQDILSILMYIINIISYTSVFISGSVLSLKLLKSRSNLMFENLMRIFVMIVAIIPSGIVMIFIFISIHDTAQAMVIATNVSLVMNIIISYFILYSCKGMMNGRELKSD